MGAPATVTFATRGGMSGCAGNFCPDKNDLSRGTANFVW
jgi:hypothetical protein